MITYSAKKPLHYVRWSGSVAPRALSWAVPCALLAYLYNWAMHTVPVLEPLTVQPTTSETTGWTMFTSILGFLLVFRAQLSYSRYWEGLTLVEQACGVWLNGCSNLIAFCTSDPKKEDQVEEFQYMLSRMMSLLVSYSLSEASTQHSSSFEHLDLEGIDPESIQYLEGTSAKVNVTLQWVQRLVVENARSGVLDIAPPILSRVFQEFSIGIVHFIDASKISNTPFPFAFAQMVWIMLSFFSVLVVPVICALGMEGGKASIYTFLIVFVFWSLHHIAVEIEMPFGDDYNDLPLTDINRRFNKTLERLLDHKAQQTPSMAVKPRMSVRFLKRESTIGLEVTSEKQTPKESRRNKLLGLLGGSSVSHIASFSSPTKEAMASSAETVASSGGGAPAAAAATPQGSEDAHVRMSPSNSGESDTAEQALSEAPLAPSVSAGYQMRCSSSGWSEPEFDEDTMPRMPSLPSSATPPGDSTAQRRRPHDGPRGPEARLHAQRQERPARDDWHSQRSQDSHPRGPEDLQQAAPFATSTSAGEREHDVLPPRRSRC